MKKIAMRMIVERCFFIGFSLRLRPEPGAEAPGPGSDSLEGVGVCPGQ